MFSQPQLYADAGRNQIYQSWFRSSKLVDKTLCEIGFGSGILSMLALQCLPKHIIAYERNGELYEYAQWCLKKSGLQNRITLYNEHVTPADVTGDVDVIFAGLSFAPRVGSPNKGPGSLPIKSLFNTYLV